MRTGSLSRLAICVLVSYPGFGSLAGAQNGIITTVAGNGTQGFAGDGGPAASASLSFPYGVAVDASGNLFLTDQGNYRIRKVSAGGIITTVAGNGTSGFSGDGGPATSAELNGPFGIAVDASGNLFIADTANNRIRKVSAGGTITTVAGNGSVGFAGDGGPATAASLNQPIGVAVDASGNLFIGDSLNGRIRKVSAGGIIATFAGGGTGGVGDGGQATSASLSLPYGVAVDASGNLFIADLLGNRIRKVSASGIITTIAGTGICCFSSDGGPATSALVGQPTGVAVDASGNIFIADKDNNRIREVSVSGIITTVAGNGTGGFSGDGGPATLAELYQPSSVAVNTSGNLFIADYVNDRIRELSVPASSGSPIAIPLPAAVTDVDVNPNTNQVYVGGNINNVVQNIVWIDGNTNGIVKSLGPGQGEHVNPATNKIYAADLYAGHILVYSGSDGSLLNTISAFGCPVEAVVDSSLNHVWGTGQCGGGNDPAFLIDGSTNTLISGYIGSGGVMGGTLAVNPATHALYMSINGVEKEVNASTLAVTNAPFSASVVAFNLLAASMYGADSSGKNVVVINYGTESVVATLPVSQTGAIAVSPTRNRVYAVDLSVSPPVIKVVAGGSNTLIGSIPLRSGDQPCCSMAVNSSSGTIYLPVVNSGSPFLLVIDDTLTSNPPVSTPVLTSLSPSSAVAGVGALTVTLNGSGFVSGSVVQWNGTALQTTFISSTQLTAAVSAGDIASAGIAQITVTNGASATSNSLPFTISQTVSGSYSGCSGQPATGKLQLSTMSLNPTSGTVQINGVDTRDPTTPFTWNWGDSTTTQGFFPQSHTYSNVQLNYSLQVTSHENDGSTDCAQLSILFNTQTTGQITSVTTAYAGPVIAQNDFIVIKGSNLVPSNTPAGGTIWSGAPSFASGLMPTQLGGVSVTVNNKPAFVEFFCSAATASICPQDQLNILAPLDNTIGPVPVVVTSGGVSSPPFTVSMQAVAPSFLLFSTAGYIAATHPNNTPVGSTTLYPGSTTPAVPGEEIAVYAFGFGLPATPLVNGSASQSGSLPVLPVCKVGGTAVVLAFAGLISPGLYQLNLTIPATAANGDNAISCTYNGATTPAGDLITVQSGTTNPTLTTLTIATSGSGSGTVSSSPGGTSCGSGCLSFAEGTVITLTATANTGSTFAGWSGACSGTGSCSVTMSSSQAVIATFDLTATIAPQLAGAFNFPGPYPLPGLVVYTNQAGQTITSRAHPGQIFFFAAPSQMDLTAATALVEANNGSIIAQIPSSGLYWVQVGLGAEAAFIAAVQNNPAVIFVGPNVPGTGSQTSVVDLSGAISLTPLNPTGLLAQFDNFQPVGNQVCGLSHGAAANTLLEAGGLTSTGYDLSELQQGTNQVALLENQFPLVAGSDVGFALERAAQGSLNRGQKLVVNASLQAGGQPNDGQDRSMCETNLTLIQCSAVWNGTTWVVSGGNYASWKTDEFSFLVGVAGALEFMPQNLLDNTMVVVSAGNSGLALTREIGLIQTLLPNAFPHMLIVGATGAGSQPFLGYNHSTDPTAMLYAPGVNVVIPQTGGCLANGTSFASPQVANLAGQLAQLFPNVTTTQIVQAIMTAAPVVNGLRTLPSLAQAMQALTQQFTLTVASAGTGSGAVRASPSGPTYTRGTVVLLTASPSSGSTFAGWSGACSGTGGCSVTMNSNLSVTATFNLTSTSGGSGSETWTGSMMGTDCGSFAGDACDPGAGTWSFSYTISLTCPSSVVAALDSGALNCTGTMSGGQTVASQSDPTQYEALLPSSVTNLPVSYILVSGGGGIPAQISLTSNSSQGVFKCAQLVGCLSLTYQFVPASISADAISGTVIDGIPAGTFTLAINQK